MHIGILHVHLEVDIKVHCVLQSHSNDMGCNHSVTNILVVICVELSSYLFPVPFCFSFSLLFVYFFSLCVHSYVDDRCML